MLVTPGVEGKAFGPPKARLHLGSRGMLRSIKVPVPYLGLGLHQSWGQPFGIQVGGEETRPGSVLLGKEAAEGGLLHPGHAGPVGEVVNRPQVTLTEDKTQNLLHPGST